MITPFLIEAAIDDARYLCPADGSGTHHTWLYGDIEGAVGEIFPSKEIGCRGYRLHLGMGGNIAEGLSKVMGAGDDPVLTNHYRPDGNLTFAICLAGLVEGTLHIEFIFFLLFFCCHGAKVRKK